MGAIHRDKGGDVVGTWVDSGRVEVAHAGEGVIDFKEARGDGVEVGFLDRGKGGGHRF